MAEIWKVDNRTYHADTTKAGSTMLKKVLRSPALYRRCYLDEKPLVDEPSDTLILGSAVHCLVLEPENFDRLYACRPPGIDGRTVDGKQKLAAFRLSAMGKQELTPDVLHQAKAMAAAVLAVPLAKELIDGATKEQAIVWDEGDVPCKLKSDMFISRPDQDSDLLMDLKTTSDPSPEVFGRGGAFGPIAKYRYDMSMFHYTRGTSRFTSRPCAAGLIVVGNAEPFDVYVYDMTPWLEIGAMHWNKAMELFRWCRDEGTWQRPEQQGIVTLTPSRWDYPED